MTKKKNNSISTLWKIGIGLIAVGLSLELELVFRLTGSSLIEKVTKTIDVFPTSIV